jgi:hypothetical protein
MFYCYIHKRKDGSPFYVGKGSYSRATSLAASSRAKNFWHRNIVKKEGKENIIIELISCKTEKEALLLEKQWIAIFRSDGYTLCNFTDGGEGTSGGHWKLSNIARQNISIGLKGRQFSNIHKQNLSNSFIYTDKMKENIEKLHYNVDICKKRALSLKTSKKAIEQRKMLRSFVIKLTEFQVKEIRTEYLLGGVSQGKLAKKYNVSRVCIGNIINKRTWKDI